MWGVFGAVKVGAEVEVASRPANPEEDAHIWTSSGTGSFSIRSATEEDDVKRGCRITINVMDTQLEFLEEARLKSIIER